jgi:hypothetical protein
MNEEDPFGRFSCEEASERLTTALKIMQEDPCYKYFILPLLEERVRYSSRRTLHGWVD